MNIIVISKDAADGNHLRTIFQTKMGVKYASATLTHFDEYGKLSLYLEEHKVDFAFIEIDFKTNMKFPSAGSTIASRVQKTHPDTIIIMLTGSTMKAGERGLLFELGLKNELVKNANQNAVYSSINAAIKLKSDSAALLEKTRSGLNVFLAKLNSASGDTAKMAAVLDQLDRDTAREYSKLIEQKTETETLDLKKKNLWRLVFKINRNLLNREGGDSDSAVHFSLGYAMSNLGGSNHKVSEHLNRADQLSSNNIDRLKKTTEIFLQLSMSGEAISKYRKLMSNRSSINFENPEEIKTLASHADLQHVINDPALLESVSTLARIQNNAGIATVRSVTKAIDVGSTRTGSAPLTETDFSNAMRSYDCAINMVDKVLGNEVSERLLFNKALCLAKNPHADGNMKKTAIDILTKLSRSETFPRFERCKELIKILQVIDSDIVFFDPEEMPTFVVETKPITPVNKAADFINVGVEKRRYELLDDDLGDIEDFEDRL